MKEIIIQELKRLGIPRIFLVSFDKEGRYYAVEGTDGHELYAAEQCILFYLFKGCWTVRYIDENKNVHPEFIDKYGFRIAVDSEGYLCLYQTKELKERVLIDVDDFHNSFDKIWGYFTEDASEFHYHILE